jgi:hypothetical protein
MMTLSKALVGTVAAGAMAITAIAPAQAQSRNDRDRGGISAGEIIAGALVIGGIAAIASAASRNDRYDDYRGRGQGYRPGYSDPRSAVEQCVRTAERDASRQSYRGNAKVTDVRDISRTRDGYRVKGRIAVNTMGRDYRRGDSRYGRGWDNDYRGWNDRYAGYDAGKFTCEIRNGRVSRLNYSGIRGL